MPAVLTVTYLEPSNSEDVLRAVSGDGSKELLSIKARINGGSGLAVADLDGDTAPEIVGVTTTYEVRPFEHDGTPGGTAVAMSRMRP